MKYIIAALILIVLFNTSFRLMTRDEGSCVIATTFGHSIVLCHIKG